jgi:dihydrofolate reductase
MTSVDTLIMGRKTFEQILTFGKWPYGETPVIILSSKRVEIPTRLGANVSFSSEDLITLTQRLSKQGSKHIYVDGGLTIQNFLKAKLLDEITITLIPIALGDGKSLFTSLNHDVKLKHISTKTFDFGFVQLKYKFSY